MIYITFPFERSSSVHPVLTVSQRSTNNILQSTFQHRYITASNPQVSLHYLKLMSCTAQMHQPLCLQRVHGQQKPSPDVHHMSVQYHALSAMAHALDDPMCRRHVPQVGIVDDGVSNSCIYMPDAMATTHLLRHPEASQLILHGCSYSARWKREHQLNTSLFRAHATLKIHSAPIRSVHSSLSPSSRSCSKSLTWIVIKSRSASF